MKPAIPSCRAVQKKCSGFANGAEKATLWQFGINCEVRARPAANDEVRKIVDTDDAPAVPHSRERQRYPATHPSDQLAEIRAGPGTVHQRCPYHHDVPSRRGVERLELPLNGELGLAVRIKWIGR